MPETIICVLFFRVNRLFDLLGTTRYTELRGCQVILTIHFGGGTALIYIGMDDTDNKTSRGTGRLARAVAATLSEQLEVWGVTRHQLLVDPRVPYTSHNSCNVIHFLAEGPVDLVA